LKHPHSPAFKKDNEQDELSEAIVPAIRVNGLTACCIYTGTESCNKA